MKLFAIPVAELTGRAGKRRAGEVLAVRAGLGQGVIIGGKPQAVSPHAILVVPDQTIVRCDADYLTSLLREANYLLN